MKSIAFFVFVFDDFYLFMSQATTLYCIGTYYRYISTEIPTIEIPGAEIPREDSFTRWSSYAPLLKF